MKWYNHKNRISRGERDLTVDTEVNISKKKWCIIFVYRPEQNENKVTFFSELNLSLNQCVNEYDVVIGDLNIDISDKRKDNNNFLSDLRDTSSLQYIIMGRKLVIKVT